MKKIVKNRYFFQLFFGGLGLLLIFNLFGFFSDESNSDFLFEDFLIFNITIFIFWFIISTFFTFCHLKWENFLVGKEKIMAKK